MHDPKQKKKNTREGGNSEEVELREELTKLSADFENFRKDAAHGMRAAEMHAIASAVRAIAPALDAMVLAMRTKPEEEHQTLHQGIRRVYDQFVKALASLGVVPVPIEGSYDPKFHEAIERVEGEAYAIVEVVSGGWMWKEGERVIVPAKVKVGAG